MATPNEIAQWMLDEFNRNNGVLWQYAAAKGIREKFGEGNLYLNQNGNWAIKKPILDAFRKLTPEGIVWSRGDQGWKKRQPHHPIGKRMVD